MVRLFTCSNAECIVADVALQMHMEHIQLCKFKVVTVSVEDGLADEGTYLCVNEK